MLIGGGLVKGGHRRGILREISKWYRVQPAPNGLQFNGRGPCVALLALGFLGVPLVPRWVNGSLVSRYSVRLTACQMQILASKRGYHSSTLPPFFSSSQEAMLYLKEVAQHSVFYHFALASNPLCSCSHPLSSMQVRTPTPLHFNVVSACPLSHRHDPSPMPGDRYIHHKLPAGQTQTPPRMTTQRRRVLLSS